MSLELGLFEWSFGLLLTKLLHNERPNTNSKTQQFKTELKVELKAAHSFSFETEQILRPSKYPWNIPER